MNKTRLEAFSDGVIAVIITIMVLEMKVPHGDGIESLAPVVPVFLSYVLSFVYAGIYWSNHHHLFHVVEHVNGRILWANLHLLFWLSLVPFTTAWMNESHFHAVPVAAYGAVLLMCGVTFVLLTRSLIRLHGSDSALARLIRSDRKGKVSVLLYAFAIPLAFLNVWVSCAIYAAVAAIWIVPDPRIERIVA